MATTLRSATTPGSSVEVFRCPGGDVLLSLSSGSAIYVRETDLKSALGIDDVGCCLKAAIQRAELAEAAAEAEAEGLDHWHERAKAAEAALARIKTRVDASPSRWIKAQYAEAVRDVPAFTPPTKAGVRFEAHSDYHGTITFRTILDGPSAYKYLHEDKDALWTGESVMEELTGHRLIGAEA